MQEQPKPTLDTRDKIIQEATTLFLQNGFAQTTIKQISLNANIAYGTTYNYFENKSILFLEIMDDTFIELYSMAREFFFPNTITEAQMLILAQVKRFLSTAHTKKAFLLIIKEAIESCPIVRKKWCEIQDYFISTITQDITYSQNKGLLREGVQPKIAAVSWYSTNEWFLWALLADEHTLDFESLCDEITTAYVNSIYKV